MKMRNIENTSGKRNMRTDGAYIASLLKYLLTPLTLHFALLCRSLSRFTNVIDRWTGNVKREMVNDS